MPVPVPSLRRVGAAITITPHSEALLAEASRIAERLRATLTMIHTGISQAESHSYLEEAAERLIIPHEQHIVWNQSDPAEALRVAAKQAGIDLLVLRMFDGPLLGRRRFLGSVARHLAERAHCSLWFITHPQAQAYNYRRIVVITDFSENARVAAQQALWLAETDGADCVYVVSIHTIFMKARAEVGARTSGPARTREEEEQLMEQFVAKLPPSEVPIETRVVEATTGFAACDFADAIEADLLVLPSHNRPQGVVPPMADWALQVVPCSLWIVRSGTAWESDPR